MPKYTVQQADNLFSVYAVGENDAIVGDPIFQSILEASATTVCETLNAASVEEYGNSLDDFTSKVRRAFEAQYDSGTGEMSAWVVDVFPDRVVARVQDSYYSIAMSRNEQDEIEFQPRDQWSPVMLDYVPVSETLEPDYAPCHVTLVSEFVGDHPVVPDAPGVNKALLEQTVDGHADASPMYLTLEVARVGAVSGNKFRHTPELVASVVEQINDNKPGGIMGHIKPQDRNVAFPISDIHWVGAIQVGDSAWAKGYIPPGRADVREYYRAEMAKGGKAATSMYGGGPKIAFDNGEWSVKQFKMESLDLAPWTRAAWPGTGQFTLTSEMQHDDPPPQDNSGMEANNVMPQINWDEVRFEDLPERVVEMVLTNRTPEPEPETPPASQAAPDPELVAEMATVREMNTTLTTRVQELENELGVRRQREFDLMVDAIVAEFTDWDTAGHAEAESAVADLRNNFRAVLVAEFNRSRNEDDAPELQNVAETVWDSGFTGLASAIRNLISGGPARIGRSNGQRRDVESPNAADINRARARFGV